MAKPVEITMPAFIMPVTSPSVSSVEPLTTPEADGNYSQPPSFKMREIENIRLSMPMPHEKTLWEVLDEGRQGIHRVVIKNPFLKGLALGGFCQTAFMKYLVNLLPIHQALEEAQQELLKIDSLKDFVMPELFRSKAIEKDLIIWKFVSPREFTPWNPDEISLTYAAYIKEVSRNDPEKIIAIMYTLYGTVMSGGQTNKRIVKEKLELIKSYTDDVPEGSGVELYNICKNGNVLNSSELADFKREWHLHLCQILPLIPPEKKTEDFQLKLTAEVVNTFKTVLRIIEKNVSSNHC
jgi:hypothetical protein